MPDSNDLLTPELKLPDAFAREYFEHFRILPLRLAAGVLEVAASGEPDPQALDDLAEYFHAAPEIVAVGEEDLLEAIRRAADRSSSIIELVGAPDDSSWDGEGAAADVRDLANQPPVIRYVNILIRDAYLAGASDVHVEAGDAGPRVRLRIDGVLTQGEAPPRGMAAAVVSRIKLLADMDIAERRVPQDGRIRVRLEERQLDLRVSTLPSLHGESVVLRLLDRGGRPVSLDELGMDPETLEAFRALALRPNGIVLATGPTGSGKTTTLHAALGLRDPNAEKIVTVEDPIEYQLAGVTQVPVNTKAGVSFAAVLRHVLRQDPDVVMVGEMRDDETAGIAVRAALTGHLVFSTLHTNDAVSAVPRLNDLKVEDYLIASTIEGVLAQRLVRRVCAECCTSYRPDARTVALLAGRPEGRVTLRHGTGCAACRATGFHGRVGLFELLVFDEELKDMVTRGVSRTELRERAGERIVRSLREDGWVKVRAGITTVEEVLRVVAG